MSLHEIATQVGGMTDCHHGQAIAIITLPAQRYNEPMFPERFGDMARVMGVDTRGLTKMQAADKWFDEVERLLADLGIKTGHLNEQVGLKKEDLKEVATRTAAFGTVGVSSDVAVNEITKLLESLL
jgi:1,3-propanediol dehydrogenase